MKKKIQEMLEHFQELQEIAETQIENGYTKSWYKTFFEAKYKSELLAEILKEYKEDDNTIKVFKGQFCVSRYRIVACVDNDELYWLAWTPELGVENSHRALFMALERKVGKVLSKSQRWCGFYNCGTGNGDQKHVDLYGESSDYPHIECMSDYAFYIGGIEWGSYITSSKVKSMLKEEMYKSWKK